MASSFYTGKANDIDGKIFLAIFSCAILNHLNKNYSVKLPAFGFDIRSIIRERDSKYGLENLNEILALSNSPDYYFRLFTNTLTFQLWYLTILLTAESSSVPDNVSYHEGLPGTDDNLFRADISSKCVCKATYQDPSGSSFESWFCMDYSPTGERLNITSSSGHRFKAPYILLDTREFIKQMYIKYRFYVAKTALPDLVSIPLDVIKKVKNLATRFNRGTYFLSLDNTTVIQANRKKAKCSFRVLSSSSFIAENLIEQAAVYRIPSRLSLALRERYINQRTKEMINLSFSEATFCFVFGLGSLKLKTTPKLYAYLKDYEQLNNKGYVSKFLQKVNYQK